MQTAFGPSCYTSSSFKMSLLWTAWTKRFKARQSLMSTEPYKRARFQWRHSGYGNGFRSVLIVGFSGLPNAKLAGAAKFDVPATYFRRTLQVSVFTFSLSLPVNGSAFSIRKRQHVLFITGEVASCEHLSIKKTRVAEIRHPEWPGSPPDHT